MTKCNSKKCLNQKNARIEIGAQIKVEQKENNQQNSNLQSNYINNYIKCKRFKPYYMVEIVQLNQIKNSSNYMLSSRNPL